MSTVSHPPALPNPLLQEWSSSNHGLPPFDQFSTELFESALTTAMAAHVDEISAIAGNPLPPTFSNTILALDNAGKLYAQVVEIFANLCGSVGVPELQTVEMQMAAPMAAHANRISNFPGLFDRIDAVYQARGDLDKLQIRLVERFHLDAVRAGAKFSSADQAAYSKIVEELADLTTKFTQNVMADEAEIYLELTDPSGLPADLLAAAVSAGQERGLAQPIITLSRSLVEPFLTYSDNKALREKAWKLWTRRGELVPSRDNLAVARRILQLRHQQATMHSYATYGHYATADTMAGSPEKVQKLLEEVWERAKGSISKEREELEAYMSTQADASPLEAWDWRYVAEKVRSTQYNLDNSEVKVYFPLSKMTQAIFDCAEQLYGLTFQPTTLKAYHPDVMVYEVFKGEELMALFLADNYARPHKRSGAWMSELRTQHYSQGKRVIPIVMNNNNFNKPSSGKAEDCLLTFDDARTLFHEFGHGLHGMLSDVQYHRLASTNVLRDFVELPSQLYEHWLSEDKVLNKHARHYQTNDVKRAPALPLLCCFLCD